MGWRVTPVSLLFPGTSGCPAHAPANTSSAPGGTHSHWRCLGRKTSGRRRDKRQVHTKLTRRIWSPVGATSSAVSC